MQTIKFADEDGSRLVVCYMVVSDKHHAAALADLNSSGRHTKSGLPINQYKLESYRSDYGARIFSQEQYAEYQRKMLGSARPATDRQIAYLRILGHVASPDITVAQASALIDQLKHAHEFTEIDMANDPEVWAVNS